VTFEECTRHIDWSLNVGRRRTRQTARQAASTHAGAPPAPDPGESGRAAPQLLGVKAHLDTVTERAAAPIIAKYAGVLAAADIEVFTRTTTFAILRSLRLDRGPSGPVHPWPRHPAAGQGVDRIRASGARRVLTQSRWRPGACPGPGRSDRRVIRGSPDDPATE
jgi:hypothetical protein